MVIKIDSEASCRAAYIDYYTNKNTNVTEDDMRRIVKRYDSATRQSWQNAYTRASGDDNRYEFDDEQFETITENSYKDTKDEYGEDVNVKVEKARNVSDGTGAGVAAAGAVAGTAIGAGAALNSTVLNIGGGNGMLAKLLGKIGNMGTKTVAGKSVQVSGIVGYIISGISCILSFTLGLMAKLNKANEEEVKAVNELYGEMEAQQEVIDEQQSELSEIQRDIQKASDKATSDNEAANKTIQTKTGEHMGYVSTYNVLKVKIDSGQPLSESERSLYNNIVKIMNGTAEGVNKASTKAQATAAENYEIIDDFNSDFDVVATNIAEVKGVTDYAAEIDEATQKSCNSQAKIQKVNQLAGFAAAAGMAISTAVFAAELGIINPAAWVVIAVGAVLAGLAITGAIFSGKASQEQAQWAAETGNEVELRVVTQEANEATQENFDEGVDNYNLSKAAIESMEINEPKNIQPPTPAPAPLFQTPEDKTRKNPFIS